MQFDKLHLNPARNPAVLDTATWDVDNAWQLIQAVENGFWPSARQALATGSTPVNDTVTLHAASIVRWRESEFCLASLTDGQHVFLEFGSGSGQAELGEAIGKFALGQGRAETLTVYPTHQATIVRYMTAIDPAKAPQALGTTPRLGIGSRMTTASWPGIYQAMLQGGFAANAIQNSVREANLLEDLLATRPAEMNYGPNLGSFASGHAGSSFEGLWVGGVLEAIKSQGPLRYGADADHMQVKRGPGRLERAKRVLESVRHYTFFTMDVSDILDYLAVRADPATARQFLEQKIANDRQRRKIIAYHGDPQRIAGKTLRMDEVALGRFVGKYWDALAAMKALTDHVDHLKAGRPFDLEFAIDEVPPEMTACQCITSDEEMLFLIRECQRRGIPLTHIAPNIGVEKEMDYRCPDGIEGLEARIRYQCRLGQEFGLMLDFHSGDDLSRDTRRVIGRATKGFNHFKISPALQTLFAETMEDVQPATFQVWWDDTLAFARSQATQGSSLATRGLQQLVANQNPSPSARHTVFQHYCFASLGRRDEQGRFALREQLYDLSAEFQQEYTRRLVRLLLETADDLFHQ